ncbi:uncharacterized protein TNCV_1179551 [Trichonephila clavipes]|nr:uncharacterized protein TNCV_1179501 [Trichonephila clavipes]GFV82937.1 uncharacterized protein TNCV_1179521 [Trichonephila clavipes]GFV82940.1 uncharacterized protein TNCV_1179551 [Trichonephila clavipes]
MEPNQIVLSPAWCSKLHLTTGKQQGSCRNEFRRPGSGAADQILRNYSFCDKYMGKEQQYFTVMEIAYKISKAVIPTRGLLATDHVILNHGQVTWTTPELAPPLLTTTPHQREDVSALDRFNVHRCPTRRVFSGTGLEPVTKQATVRYLYHSATAATCLLRNAHTSTDTTYDR